MRTLATIVLGGMLIVSTPVSAAAPIADNQPDPAEMAEARTILAIMFPPAEREATFNRIGAAFADQYRNSIPRAAFADPGLRAIVDEGMDRSLEVEKPVLARHLPAYFEAIAKAYSREFSLAELKDIHAFALTQSGRHYLGRAAALVSDPDVSKEMTAMMSDAQAATEPLAKDMTAKIVAYLKAHPDVARKIGAGTK